MHQGFLTSIPCLLNAQLIWRGAPCPHDKLGTSTGHGRHRNVVRATAARAFPFHIAAGSDLSPERAAQLRTAGGVFLRPGRHSAGWPKPREAARAQPRLLLRPLAHPALAPFHRFARCLPNPTLTLGPLSFALMGGYAMPALRQALNNAISAVDPGSCAIAFPPNCLPTLPAVDGISAAWSRQAHVHAPDQCPQSGAAPCCTKHTRSMHSSPIGGRPLPALG
jgi:hypothetical protein